ncbi:hypothetical protein BDF20DRAFT_997108 [Mycotypha africana]|uniref:uncharacterized protein n=1 Tax=Mycotypha africana TaxID=64632 RepID=UPI0022FFFF8C|nr:uncharacterized protein BDF20DRAFT_997108 [Mycotypha africana]KAI8991176.1 hypothetical protein BDF20DRAFT_997108 [Mycotypha africana]
MRNINDDIDYLSVEEKPSLKGVKSDLKKGKALQQCMLKMWTKHFHTATIMNQFEAITCPFFMPAEETHGASFARLLTAVLSLKRVVLLNYTKLNRLLQPKYNHEIEMMRFSIDNEDLLLRSDSSAGLDLQDKQNMGNLVVDCIDNALEEEMSTAIKDA